MSPQFLKVQNLEVPKGSKKQGYLKVSEKPAGLFQVPITVINGSGDGPTLVINGGVHGSEYNGPAAALRLQVELDPADIKGSVIVVPLVNTLAFEGRWMHSNPVDYRDLTDCFIPEVPKRGSGHPVISYQLAVTFYKEILSRADYRLDLHGGDLEEDVLESTWYRRTGEDLGRDDMGLALCRNFGWTWIREGVRKPQPGKSSDEMPMPVSMGTEALGMGRCQYDIVDRVVHGCINVMRFLKMTNGEPEIPAKAKVYHPYHIYSKRGGFFISHVKAGDMVSEGQLIGELRNLFGEVVENLEAPTAGIIHMVTTPAIYEGDVLFEIGTNIREIA